MKQAKLQLTQEHIDKAGAGACNCPIAKMMRSNGFPNALVGNNYWRKDREDQRIPLTASQSLIVCKFDSGKPIRPCIILVNMP